MYVHINYMSILISSFPLNVLKYKCNLNEILTQWEKVLPKAFVAFPSKVRPAEVCLLLQGFQVKVGFLASLWETPSLFCELLGNCPGGKKRLKCIIQLEAVLPHHRRCSGSQRGSLSFSLALDLALSLVFSSSLAIFVTFSLALYVSL